MAEISLRAYVKEIDNLVEREQLDEAIAHCRHILEIYSKHLETYRVLGKAYLEAKRYGDAADIFQRVLSAIPDDFVAHIGMAIVREDEGNLDAAIWHIERAFETNPANPAIQQELRRLIGRRDGLEPHKVRMTRGALSRMYAHGELYPQAIAELTSALKDDPDRPDLQVLLATMYWRSDQHVEAAEICSHILEKLPYCREANRITAASLQASKKTDEASIYHRRLAALDPYAAFIETANIDPQTVDASTVRIEKLAWQPGQPILDIEREQPDWATSLGVELGGEQPEEIGIIEKPSWLEGLEKPDKLIEAASVDEEGVVAKEPVISAEPAADTEIPAWMREAGWREAAGEAVEGAVSFSDDELSMLDMGQPLDEGELTPLEAEQPADLEELTPADIPGWLQDIAPSEPEVVTSDVSSEIPEKLGAVEEEPTDWLSGFDEAISEVQPELEQPLVVEPELPQEEIAVEFAADEAASEPVAETAEPALEEEAPGLPTWLESETPGATTTIVTWLGDKQSAEIEAPSEPAPEGIVDEGPSEPVEDEEAEPVEGLPAWLEHADLDQEGVAPEIAELIEEGPSWLAGVAEVAAQQDTQLPEEEEIPSEEEPVPATPSEESLEWLQTISESETEAAHEPAQAEDVPSWLESIGEPEAEVSPEQPTLSAEAPDWLKGIAEPEAAEAPLEQPIPTQEAPDWLTGIAEPVVETTAEQPTPTGETPEWLGEFTAAADEELETFPETLVTEEEKEIPVPAPANVVEEAVPEVAIPTPELEVEVMVPSGKPEYPADIVTDDGLDDDEVLGWLEGLAARQGADEEELITSPEERTTEPPTVIEMLSEASIDESQVIPEEPEEGLEWLERLATERGIGTDISLPAVEPPTKSEEIEAPEWLDRMATAPIPKVLTPELGSEIPDWLEQPETGEPTPIPDEPSPPEPIAEVEPEAPPLPEPVPVEPIAEAEPEVTPLPEPVPVEPIAEAEPEVTPLPEPAPVEPIAEPEVTPLPEPVPVEVGAAVPLTPETLEAPPITEPIPVEIVAEVEPEAPPTVKPIPIETVAEVEAPPTPEPTPVQPVAEVPPAPEELKPPPSPPKPEKPAKDPAQLLDSARQALASDNFNRAVADYRSLITNKSEVETVIEDLRTALERDPNVSDLWQVLGDAYMKNDQLSEAISAYRRGMEVA